MSLFGALFIPIPLAFAEGSPQFDTRDATTGGQANDQQVFNQTVLYVDVLNPGGATERICWTGTNNLTVRHPTTDAVVETLSEDSCTGALATTGAYRLQLQSSQPNNSRWEVRVCASTVSSNNCRSTSQSFHRDGRLWSYQWRFESNTSFAANRSNNGSVFAIVPGGAVGKDAVIEMQMTGVSGAYYKLFANSIGPETTAGVRVGRSVPADGHRVTPQYPLYLHPPQRAAYDWIVPVVEDVELYAECGSGIVTGASVGSVSFESNCCLSRYSTAFLPRSFVTPPARSLALRDHLRRAEMSTESERPARA